MMRLMRLSSRTRDNIFWVMLIGIVVFSVIRTQSINTDLKRAQADLLVTQANTIRSQNCTEAFLGTTVRALNERTQYSLAQADANIDLQKAQLRFVGFIITPGEQSGGDRALREYFDALQEYNRLVSLNAGKAESFPYPTSEDYRACLSNTEE